jgi:hypothetical protein
MSAWRHYAVFWGVGLGAWLGIAGWAIRAERTLHDGSLITGYALFAVILALALFNLRKRLLVLPIGSVRAWMIAHGVLGALCLPLYLQHAGGLWPNGFYEQALAAAFYVVMLSGLAGYVFERTVPQRLVELEREVIYERIPSKLAALRERAEALVMEAVRETGSDTLGRYYAESLQWYFLRPRFLVSHLVGGARGGRWIAGHIGALRRYLNESERRFLDRVETLALRKNQLDAHYALQSVLKLWLFVHVPAAVLLVGLACWHLLIVNIYRV